MPLNRKILTLVTAVALFTASTQAQEVYFRNKPYKGPRTGSWEQLMVGLKETAKIFEIPLVEQNGAFVLGDAGESGTSPGRVVVNGIVVPSEPGESGPLVNLKKLSEAAGLTYKSNKELGGIDITKPASKGGKDNGNVFYSEGVPNYISKDNPGADPEVDKKAVRGKVTLAFVYAPTYEDKAYREAATKVDQLAQVEGVILFKFPKGSKDSPLYKKYPQPSPALYFFDRRARYRASLNGHSFSIQSALATIDRLKKEP